MRGARSLVCKQEQFSREGVRAVPEGRIVWVVNDIVQQGNVAKNNNPENNFRRKITLRSKAILCRYFSGLTAVQGVVQHRV